MFRPTLYLRHPVCLCAVVPFALLVATCSETATRRTPDDGGLGGAAGISGSGGTGGTGGAGTGGSAGASDTTPPTVVSTYPLTSATGEAATVAISATFSEAMAPLSLTSTTFTLKRGTTLVAGEVTYLNDTVTFSPTSELALGTAYTATITTSATDVAGNALAATYVWSFTTDAAARVGPAPVFLGGAGKYVVLAMSKIANTPTSAITGDLGMSPAAASSVTGFSLTKAGTKWTSSQVTGSVFAADNDPPTPSNLTTAVTNMLTAYTDAAGRPTPTFLNLGGGAIGNLTLAPGLYKWTSSVTIPANVTIAGGANDVWIFQITGDLKMSSEKRMSLSGGAKARNVFWQVAGLVDLGTTSHAEGIVLSKTAINLGTGASINGRLLAQTAVTIAGSIITSPAR